MQYPNDLHISALQPNILPRDVPANLHYYSQQIASLQAAEPHLVVLPEMFATGFEPSPEIVEKEGGPILRWMQDTAQLHSLLLCGSVAVKAGENCYNRFYACYPNGQLIHYDKRKLFSISREAQLFQPGQERITFNFADWRILPQICFDVRFPEVARSANDYDLLIYVASFPASRAFAWNALLRARAIENLTYLVGVNRVGDDSKETHYQGDSVILSPDGAPLAEAAPNSVQWIEATLSYEKLLRFRKRFPFLEEL